MSDVVRAGMHRHFGDAWENEEVSTQGSLTVVTFTYDLGLLECVRLRVIFDLHGNRLVTETV